MEKINGKQVVRIGVVGAPNMHRHIPEKLLRAMCKVRGKEIAPISGDAYTRYGKFKVGFKEVDLESDKYYYKLIHFPDQFDYEYKNSLKSLFLGAANIDVFVWALEGPSDEDERFLAILQLFDKPIAGIFAHDSEAHKIEIDWEVLEVRIEELLDDYEVTFRTDFNGGQVVMALRKPFDDPDRNIVALNNNLESNLGRALAHAQEVNPNIYNTDKINTLVWSVGPQEGFQAPLKEGQKVIVEFPEASLSMAATIKNSDAGNHGPFLDDRRTDPDCGTINFMHLHLENPMKLRAGYRFFLKIGDRIDGVGIVSEVKSYV